MSVALVADELCRSYQRQLEWYATLRDTTQQELSRVIMSRGDLSGFIDGMAKKQALLDSIVAERTRIKPSETLWQQHKNDTAVAAAAAPVNAMIDKMESVIREFLDSEAQIKRYIETKMGRQPMSPAQT